MGSQHSLVFRKAALASTLEGSFCPGPKPIPYRLAYSPYYHWAMGPQNTFVTVEVLLAFSEKGGMP